MRDAMRDMNINKGSSGGGRGGNVRDSTDSPRNSMQQGGGKSSPPNRGGGGGGGFGTERKMDMAYEAGYKDAMEKLKKNMMSQFGN